MTYLRWIRVSSQQGTHMCHTPYAVLAWALKLESNSGQGWHLTKPCLQALGLMLGELYIQAGLLSYRAR